MTPLTTKAAEIRAGLVKPLEWNEYETEGEIDRWDAQTMMGAYYEIGVDFNGYLVSHDYTHLNRAYETLEEAKAAAQSDYEARILSALNLSGIEQQAAELAEARERLAAKISEVAGLQQSPLFKLKEDMRERAEAAESERDELLREKERLGAGWRPIETAPKDGTTFLAYQAEEGVDFFHWQDFGADSTAPKGWRDSFIHVYPEGSENGPKHWMPLPVPPAAEQEAV